MKKLTIHAVTTKEGGWNYVRGSLDRKKSFVQSVGPGVMLEMTVEPHSPPKTFQQCKTFFGNLAERVVSEMNDRGWTFTLNIGGHEIEARPTVFRVKEFLYDAFAPHTEDGDIKTIGNMKMNEMAAFYQQCVDGLAAEPWFIYIPDPDSNWKS